MDNKKSLIKNQRWIPFFAMVAVISWGFAFPLIKLGMEQFAVAGEDTAGKTLFAGIRFLIAGIAVLLAAKLRGGIGDRKKENGGVSSSRLSGAAGRRDWLASAFLLFLLALVNTALHYFFFYLGLSYSDGSRAAILDSLGTFLLILLAVVVFRERFTRTKLVGCLAGFAGIVILNLGGGGSALSLRGDGMMLLNSICSAFGGILTRIVTRRVEAVRATGISLALGGTMLIGAGAAAGGRLTAATGQGVLILAALAAISALGFAVYNQLLTYHPVGKVAIYNSFIPVIGAALSCLLLREPFYLRYIPAALLVMAGVYFVNRKD